MKVYANEQMFQSFYLSPSENWRERVVFHTPLVKNGITGVLVLKSLRLENLLGGVFSGPQPVLDAYRKKIENLDEAEQIGTLSDEEILDVLIQKATEENLTLHYVQAPESLRSKYEVDVALGLVNDDMDFVQRLENIHVEIEQAADIEPLSKVVYSFFDPVTKRNLIKYGPSYFDPSLPTMDDANLAFYEKRSPSSAVTPHNLNPVGKKLWQALMAKFKDQIYKHATVGERWLAALKMFAGLCKHLGIDPYETVKVRNADEILKDAKENLNKAVSYAQACLDYLISADLTQKGNTRFQYEGQQRAEDTIYFVFGQTLRLQNLASPYQVFDALSKKFRFIFDRSTFRTATKAVTQNTVLTFIENRQHNIDVKIQLGLPRLEAEQFSKKIAVSLKISI
jgi:hypothetical protein